MEELRQQLMKSAQIGQGLLAENQELKSRSKEDTEQVRSINYTLDYLVTRSNLFLSIFVLVSGTTSTSRQAWRHKPSHSSRECWGTQSSPETKRYRDRSAEKDGCRTKTRTHWYTSRAKSITRWSRRWETCQWRAKSWICEENWAERGTIESNDTAANSQHRGLR